MRVLLELVFCYVGHPNKDISMSWFLSSMDKKISTVMPTKSDSDVIFVYNC